MKKSITYCLLFLLALVWGACSSSRPSGKLVMWDAQSNDTLHKGSIVMPKGKIYIYNGTNYSDELADNGIFLKKLGMNTVSGSASRASSGSSLWHATADTLFRSNILAETAILEFSRQLPAMKVVVLLNKEELRNIEKSTQLRNINRENQPDIMITLVNQSFRIEGEANTASHNQTTSGVGYGFTHMTDSDSSYNGYIYVCYRNEWAISFVGQPSKEQIIVQTRKIRYPYTATYNIAEDLFRCANLSGKEFAEQLTVK